MGHEALPGHTCNLPSFLCIDSYQMASYLKEVTSRAQLRRLAQLRTGSHQLRVWFFVCLFFYRGRPDQGRVREQSPAAQCGISRVNVRAARCVIKYHVRNMSMEDTETTREYRAQETSERQ
jgi:hypothetical protein